jgi:pyruvate/oxaloacetate carboxyltransferase
MPFTPVTAATTPVESVQFQAALDVLSSEQYAAIVNHVTTHVSGQFADKVDAKQQQINRLLTERESFETTVRDALVRFAEERSIDTTELNDLLAELDLDPVEQEFSVDVKVVAYQTVTVTVLATSSEAAEALVNDGDDDVRRLVDDELSGYDWEVEEYEATEVRDY